MSFLFKFHSEKDVVSTPCLYMDILIPNSCRLIKIKYHKHWYDSLRKLPAIEMHAGHLESKVPRVKSCLFCSLQQVATQNSDLHILILDILITKVRFFVSSASLSLVGCASSSSC